MPIARVGHVNLAYRIDGRGPTILCIMGLGGRATDWNDAFVAGLAEE